MTVSLALAAPIRLLASTPDGARLVAVHEAMYSLVSIDAGAVIRSGNVSGVAYACAVTPDGRSLLLGTRSPTLIELTDDASPQPLKGPSSASNAVAFSPDGATAYLAHGSFAASSDCYLYAFDLATRAQRWRVAPTPRDGVVDVVCVGERVVSFGEQGVVVLLDAARGASLGRVQLTEPAPYGAAMVLGAALGHEHVVAVTLDEGTAIVAKVKLASGALPIEWRTPIEFEEADEDEAMLVGRPLVAGSAVHVPVRWVSRGAARMTLVTVDATTGEVLGESELEGCESHRAVLGLADGRVAWASGSVVRVEAIE